MMWRRQLAAAALMALVIVFLAAGIPAAKSAGESDSKMAYELLAEINAWRLEQGWWPLKPNATLEAMALAQAEYVLSLPEMPKGGDIHLGTQGETPAVRALQARFNWPSYGRNDRVAVGENAADGNVRFAINYWRNSEIHRNTLLNPAYREVGIAALPHGQGYLFMVVFGARPNVLPALVNPMNNLLYLSNERYRYAEGGAWINNITRVRLFDADGRPLSSDWTAWQPTLPIPTNAGGKVYILFDGGAYQAMTEVNLSSDRIVLPGYIPGEAPQVVAVPTLAATAVPTQATESAPPATATPLVEVQPTATPEPTATPAGIPDLLVVYDDRTLSVLNVSGHPLDLRDLTLAGAASLPFTAWSRVADFPLDALPPNHCLQIRSVLETGPVAVPATCRWVRSLLTLQPDKLFWISGDFEVQGASANLTKCSRGGGQCMVDLPG